MNAALQPPGGSFSDSYERYRSYPLNLIYKASYIGALKAHQSRLDTAAPKLFTATDSEIFVPFRDLLPEGTRFKRQNILDDAALKKWLEDKSTIAPQEQGVKEDPKCRFIFISAGHSRNPLKTTHEMLLRILTFHQVMPEYLDFVSVFGSQSKPRDLRFSGFRERILLSQPPSQELRIPSLGRSGREYQLCYNLKGVTDLTPKATSAKDKQWTLRQAAFHHQFDVEKGTSLWIVTKGDLEIKERVQEMTDENGRKEDRSYGAPPACFKSSLSVHLLHSYWSTENWRWYIQWLEDVIEQETNLAVQGDRSLYRSRQRYTPEDLQLVQNYEDKANEAVMIMAANADVLASLQKFYQNLLENKDFELRIACREHVSAFATQVDAMIYDSRMQTARAQLLIRIVADRKELVLQHLQSQASESMHAIGIMSQKEAVAMRIITVVTLIYLPATFVSTFFSTDVVKYQGSNGGSYSRVAMERWIEVTVPLTVMTLVVGYCFFKRESRKADMLGLGPGLLGASAQNEKPKPLGRMWLPCVGNKSEDSLA
ncbi:MAG: hypothetical protein M1839_004507 [Geoglossum umbratile]|nr:MAG: hypothetical protein M1839_004507 [Geoglossum umbratile]